MCQIIHHKLLLTFTDKGIYCAQADCYIDPWRSVNKALITHAHSDHAKYGNVQYISVRSGIPILKYRLGSFINIQGYEYNERFNINGVKFSFHPAGHIIGSAQIRMEYKGEVWVVSGDYKLEDDGISSPFEPVKCHTFITESTFGLPSFKWKPQEMIFDEINHWWKKNADTGKVSVIAAYSLGKAQRIIQNLDTSIGKLFTHGAIENTHDVLRNQGVRLITGLKVESTYTSDHFVGSIVLAPPSALGSAWTKKFGECEEAIVSGWMAIRGIRRRRNAERGFVLSDHADWDGLNDAIKQTGAERIFVTHGYSELFARYLREQGYDADVVSTAYTGDEDSEIIHQSTQP